MGDFFQIFVAFSEKLDFTHLKKMPRGVILHLSLFGDLSKSEKLSETKPPLYSSHDVKVLLLLRIGLERSHHAFLCVTNECPIS